MKKSILFLLILFMACSNLWGQCDNNASTDYTTDPTNDALPVNAAGDLDSPIPACRRHGIIPQFLIN
jgi:hypothetical protein